jgi:PKD repeat protein
MDRRLVIILGIVFLLCLSFFIYRIATKQQKIEKALYRTPNISNGIAYTDSAVQFEYNSPKGAKSWKWDFGDGSYSADENPSHVYDVANAYTVTLVSTGDFGKAVDSSKVITVLNKVTSPKPDTITAPKLDNIVPPKPVPAVAPVTEPNKKKETPPPAKPKPVQQAKPAAKPRNTSVPPATPYKQVGERQGTEFK